MLEAIKITDWISAVANLFLAYMAYKAFGQIIELRRQNKNEAINQLYTRMFEIQSILINARIDKDFFKPDESRYEEFEVYAQMYADFLEQIMLQKNQIDGENDIWGKYVDDILEKNIHVKRYIKEHIELYSESLTDKITKEKRKENEENIKSIVITYCITVCKTLCPVCKRAMWLDGK